MRKYGILITIGLLIFIAGCTREQNTCEDYCNQLIPEECDGSWNITGEYPDCNCDWVCDEVIPTCQTNWTCTDWSDCTPQGVQTRSCIDTNNCQTTRGKPSESRSCSFNNFCNDISNAAEKAECNSLLFEDPSYCENTNDYETCVYKLARNTINNSLCTLINNTYLRNSCESIMEMDRTECNILNPDLREICYEAYNRYLYNRVKYEEDTSYCNLIESEATTYDDCTELITKANKNNHQNNHAKCENYTYNSTINSTYQPIYYCYAYHAVMGDEPCESVKNVENLTSVFYNECVALNNNDFEYCFDLTESERDRCFAHFAYARNDTSICLDSYNEENCWYIAGKWFQQEHFCKKITNSTLKDDCYNTMARACLVNSWKECHITTCQLINNKNLKDGCILNVYKDQKARSFIYDRLA